MNRIRWLVVLACLAQAGFTTSRTAQASPSTGASPKHPKLILVLVIDQFRADYLTRFKERFLPANRRAEVGGFSYLMERGAYWPFAEYDLIQCMTGPGHATISTGSYPYQMGIPANFWYDPVKKDHFYCTEDPEYPTVGSDQVKAGVGTSPRTLQTSTFGDELKNAGYPSRVFSLALKDRAAILMGGHRSDLSLWFEPNAFRWVSSRFYLPDGKLPAWVEELNAGIAKHKGETFAWMSEGKGSGLTEDPVPMLETSRNTDRIGRQFPHQVKVGTYATLSTPYGVDLTADAAEKLIRQYNLGHGKATDVLYVSISSHDYVSHAFGPNSREMEEMTVHEDRAISRLLNAARRQVSGGLGETLVVLTADHGAPSNSEYYREHRMPSGRIHVDQLLASLETRLSERFGKPKSGKWIAFTDDLTFFFNEDAVQERKAARADLESVAKSVLLSHPGVARAWSRGDVEARRLPPGIFERQILHTYFPGRSADFYAIPKPFWMMNDDSVDHITGYAYDRTVPLILAGTRVRPGRHAERAEIIDIAPTLSYLMGVLRPATSEGRVLAEGITP